MTDRYFSFEATGTYAADTHTFTADQHDIDVTSEDITPERGNIYPQTSRKRKARRHLLGPNTWTGTVETLLYPLHATTLLYYGMGATAFALDMPQAGVNTHTITVADTIPSFIAAIGRDALEHKYTGCVVGGFTIDYAPDAALTGSFELDLRKEQPTATLDMVTFPDYDVLERAFSGVEVDAQMGAAEAAPTSVTFVEAASVSLANNFIQNNSLNSQFNAANIVEASQITGSLDIRFDSATEYADVTADTDKSLYLTATHEALALQRDIEVRLFRISYDSTSLATTDTVRYTQTLEWTGETSLTPPIDDVMEIDVVNDALEAEFTA